MSPHGIYYGIEMNIGLQFISMSFFSIMNYQRPYDKAISQANANQRQWESELLNLSYQTKEALSKAVNKTVSLIIEHTNE